MQKGERLVSLDLIRGIAVLGILLANVTAFGDSNLAYYWPPALPGGGTQGDRIAWIVQLVLVDGKFRGLFTILFGASLLLFVERLPDIQRGLLLQARRLALLLLIGLLHFFLLFRGDILFGYAVAGFFALFALRLPSEKLLAMGIIWAVVGAGLQVLGYLTPALIEAGSSAAGRHDAVTYYSEYWSTRLAESRELADVMAHGSYWQVLQHRLVEESGLLGGYFTYSFFETIPLMLIGMGLYRSGIFSAEVNGRPDWQAFAIGAVALGTAANLAAGLYAYSQGFPPYLTQLVFFGIVGLANVPVLVGGAALLGRWASRPHEGWLAERLSLAGRMALSNYVGTSLMMVLIFQGWAGGLFGTMGKIELLMVVLLGWALMLTFSRMWLARYRYGPLEWVWRCLTYGRRFDLRRAPD